MRLQIKSSVFSALKLTARVACYYGSKKRRRTPTKTKSVFKIHFLTAQLLKSLFS